MSVFYLVLFTCAQFTLRHSYLDRSGHQSPLGREEDILKVLPNIASWMQLDKFIFIILICQLYWVPVRMRVLGKG